jgi:ferredoxin
MKIIRTVHVDGCLCTGHKLCLSEAPEIFAFDDSKGVAFVKDDASMYYAVKVEDIFRAAAACPMDAILINGEVPIRAK